VSLTLSTRQVGDVTVIDASGRITLGEGSTSLRETIKSLLDEGKSKLLLNMESVSYIDSSGIGELVSGYTTVRGKGGELKLLNLSKRIYDLLQITKLYTVFPVFDDETEAIRSFS
jgi:anti-sigma B factor antagonist